MNYYTQKCECCDDIGHFITFNLNDIQATSETTGVVALDEEDITNLYLQLKEFVCR